MRERFKLRLGLDDAHLVVPPDAHLFVAEGSAFEAWDEAPFALGGLIERLESVPWDQGCLLYTSSLPYGQARKKFCKRPRLPRS